MRSPSANPQVKRYFGEPSLLSFLSAPWIRSFPPMRSSSLRSVPVRIFLMLRPLTFLRFPIPMRSPISSCRCLTWPGSHCSHFRNHVRGFGLVLWGLALPLNTPGCLPFGFSSPISSTVCRGISTNLLSERLKGMEQQGLLYRRVSPHRQSAGLAGNPGVLYPGHFLAGGGCCQNPSEPGIWLSVRNAGSTYFLKINKNSIKLTLIDQNNEIWRTIMVSAFIFAQFRGQVQMLQQSTTPFMRLQV